MWTCNNWKDYEVIDTSKGEKIERWGDYRLVRPDPQVIWDTKRDPEIWRKKNGHYHRSKKGGGEWDFYNLPEEWEISYPLFTSEESAEFLQNNDVADPVAKELVFHLKPFSFKHTGLFPEQAVNWDWFSKLILKCRYNNPDKPVKILNLFAYTGGATLAAAASGAHVTHVDSSKGIVNWAKENAKSSGLQDAPIRWLIDDCVKFVEREIRRGNKYDGIIMDPPSYGRGPKGEVWKIEESVFPLICKCSEILSEKPLFFLINSYTTGLQPAVLKYMMKVSLSHFRGATEADEIGLPVSETGLYLPCGASGRFTGSI